MIRKATRKNFPRILELVKCALVELQHPYDESLLSKKIERAFYCAPCFLIEIDDRIVGMAGLTLGECTLSGTITLSDYMFYIEPDYRNLRRLSGLVNACKSFADENKLPLRLEFISQKDEDLRIRLLRMHGFEVKAIIGLYHGRTNGR